MIIRRASFITSLDALREYPGRGLPEVAMVGKSNVGKSSMINRIANNGKLARISAEPGKTRLINLFNLNDQIVLVDLPGYGFAKVSREEKNRWAGMIEGYLSRSETLKLALMLVDMRHEPTADDVTMVGYLRHYEIPFRIAATKADKLSRAERGRNLPVICRALAVQPWQVIPFSSQDGTGRDQVLELFEELLPSPPGVE
ncbi:MAG: YihA family ribosome biogenesis GTP-binding protein [Clostridia bacterium]|nr:YihA family ribosome biogenesis GTP-binding protein [Clostridia bacterium]MBR4443005.1 YihA family ribosome biogenesis GTP-binding protein [Clostridia bacterium]